MILFSRRTSLASILLSIFENASMVSTKAAAMTLRCSPISKTHQYYFSLRSCTKDSTIQVLSRLEISNRTFFKFFGPSPSPRLQVPTWSWTSGSCRSESDSEKLPGITHPRTVVRGPGDRDKLSGGVAAAREGSPQPHSTSGQPRRTSPSADGHEATLPHSARDQKRRRESKQKFILFWIFR